MAKWRLFPRLVFAPFLLFSWQLGSCAIAMAVPPLSLPPGTPAVLDHIYEGRIELAIAGARELQQESPQEPIGYILEAEAQWWRIWCSSAEYKYGMSMPRHREKLAADQHYLELSAKALALADARLKVHETAEMDFYAGMAEALAVRLYGVRGEGRNAARAGVRAREHFLRALTLDPSIADADMGVGLYEYYVDTLSTAARVLRFFMGIPGGSKEEGIRRLQHSIKEGQITPATSRFYLAISLHNYDQRYEEALQLISPLVQQYPENPLFLLAQGDLYAKLGRNQLALAAYREAGIAAKQVSAEDCQKKVELLAQQSSAAISRAHSQAE